MDRNKSHVFLFPFLFQQNVLVGKKQNLMSLKSKYLFNTKNLGEDIYEMFILYQDQFKSLDLCYFIYCYTTLLFCLCPGLRYWRFYRSLVPWRDLTICTIKRDQTWGNRGATVSYPTSLDRYHLNIDIPSKSIFARFVPIIVWYIYCPQRSSLCYLLKYQFNLVHVLCVLWAFIT